MYKRSIHMPINRNSGVCIFDKVGKDYILLMGSKVKNNNRIYEFFGGHYEKTDKTALHTATREILEEIFNIKIESENIDILVIEIINHGDIRNELTLENENGGMTYFIGFESLEKVYNYIKYGKYKKIENFDIMKYVDNRYVNGDAKNGLNEISKLHFYYLKNANKLDVRPITKTILHHMNRKLYKK